MNAPFPSPTRLLGYRCRCCKAVTHLGDLNSEMECVGCSEPDEDPEYILDMSDVAMLRAEGTWSI